MLKRENNAKIFNKKFLFVVKLDQCPVWNNNRQYNNQTKKNESSS